jgi:hypothetical protein
MLTATHTSNISTDSFVSTRGQVTQNETPISDLEILRRVRRIRSGWSVTERIERRREAGERFASLLEALSLDHQAA